MVSKKVEKVVVLFGMGLLIVMAILMIFKIIWELGC